MPSGTSCSTASAPPPLEASCTGSETYVLNRHDDLDIDYTDTSLYEIDPTLPEINRDLTPQELEELILEDIHSIYEGKYAV